MTVTTFSELELDESLLEALQDKGFTRPTAIQAAAIPPALDGRDVLGSAPTGTGKTAAYLLPALQHLLDFPRKKSGPPRILILTPTRELAMQVADHARELAKHTHLDIATITGGVAYMNHAEVFSENQDIVVATTGRLLQYIKEENFDCRAVETLILDEADRMLDMGFAQDIEHIAGETRWRKQTLLFSATLEGDAIQDFAERLLEDPVEVSANPSTRERKKIHQWYYRADDLEHKTALLVHLLKQPEATRSIVFVRKRERVHELANWLREAGINNCYLEGEMVQGKRNEAIKRLTEGRVNVLVATDVAARGIDIPDVSHVFNFDSRAVAIPICTESGVPLAPVVKGSRFHWLKPMTICCWAKLVVILKSRLKLASLMSYARKRVRQARNRRVNHRRKSWQNAPRKKRLKRKRSLG